MTGKKKRLRMTGKKKGIRMTEKVVVILRVLPKNPVLPPPSSS